MAAPITKTAILSQCGLFRYEIRGAWDDAQLLAVCAAMEEVVRPIAPTLHPTFQEVVHV